MAKQGRLERLRAKFPDTTGIYRRAGPSDPRRSLPWSLGSLLDLTKLLADETLTRAESTPEAKEDARGALLHGGNLLDLLAQPPAGLTEESLAWAIRAATHAMVTGTMLERLIVRRVEDVALHGKDVSAARTKGGETVGGAKHEAAVRWRQEAQQEAEAVWDRHPEWSVSAVAKVIARKFDKTSNTIRQVIRKPENNLTGRSAFRQ